MGGARFDLEGTLQQSQQHGFIVCHVRIRPSFLVLLGQCMVDGTLVGTEAQQYVLLGTAPHNHYISFLVKKPLYLRPDCYC